MPVQRYRFGRFELLPSERRLLDGGQPAALGPRAFDLLVALVEHAPRFIGKDEIMARVWRGLAVEEGNLQVQVSNLRKVLGAAAIETVPGHGYRFVQPVTAAEAAAVPSRKHNLPRELTAFVGREAEVSEQHQRLGQTRLLTITGAGGLGKSRFSLQLAAGLVDAYADGVWLVELAAVADPSHVTAAFAAVLGVSDPRSGELREAVAGYVRDRELLLVVDNCEHVLTAVAELTKVLLTIAPLVKLIATSREPLHVAGEMLYPLAPLAPPARDDLSLADAIENPAVRLFVGRAMASQPAFRLGDDNVRAVAAICRRLEGIPLALELAAARVGALSLAALAERLEDRFALLNAGDRGAPARHRTLRNAIAWSYDLLSPEEREAMNRLSVLAGEFDVDAAEAVACADDALDMLAHLVDKSLVVADPDRDRFSMLDTVREYAAERLAESGREAAARDAHVAHFLALAEAIEPQLLGPGEAAARARLARDRANFLAAHTFCARAEDGAHRGVRLAAALRLYWQMEGPLQLGYDITTEALARPGAQLRDYAHCQASFAAAACAYFLGRYAEAESHAETCEAIARERGDIAKTSDALAVHAVAAIARSDLTRAAACIAQSLAFARESGDGFRIAQALNAQAEVHAAGGYHDSAAAAYAECLAVARGIYDDGMVAGLLVNLARVAATRGSLADAGAQLLEAADLIERTAYPHVLTLWLAVASGVAADRGEHEQAAMLAGAHIARATADGYRLEAADDAFLSARLAHVRALLGEEAFARAEAAGATPPAAQWLSDARDWLATSATP